MSDVTQARAKLEEAHEALVTAREDISAVAGDLVGSVEQAIADEVQSASDHVHRALMQVAEVIEAVQAL